MSRETTGKTFLVAGILCIVCSVMVSSAAVALRPRQEANAILDKNKNILVAAGLYDANEAVNVTFDRLIETKIIDFNTGEFLDNDAVDPEQYDQRRAAKDPALSKLIPTEKDSAGIKQREKYGFVYLIKKGEAIDRAILPIYGMGLWGTLYGFLAVNSDFNTVAGLAYYEHKETPGLGGEVDNPNWKSIWPGKKIFDDNGEVQLSLIKGHVDPSAKDAEYQVDGLAGATITSDGVSDMLEYWFGADGYGPFLEKMREVQP